MENEGKIPAWSPSERPRERLLESGPGALSDAELVALLLGNGARGRTAVDLGRELLLACGGLDGLGRVPTPRLTAHAGVGPAKAARLLAAVELGRRREKGGQHPRPAVNSPDDAVRLFAADLRDADRECFWVAFLDTKNQVLKTEAVSIGGLDQTWVHPREVFKTAIAISASAVIAAHNHPSGDPTPSQADWQLTRRLQGAAKLLGIRFLDHVIIGHGRYRSLMSPRHFSATGGS